MKKILLILMMFISVGLYSQTKQDSLKHGFGLYDTFESGSYMLVDSTILKIQYMMKDHLNKIQASDSVVIQIKVTSSTDNIPLGKRLSNKLINLGYNGSNQGLSEIRNDKVAHIAEQVLIENKVLNYFDKVEQDINFETGNESNNRFINISFLVIPISKADKDLITIQPIYIKTDCDSIFIERKLAELAIRKKLEESNGDRIYMTRVEYKGFRKHIAKAYSEEEEQTYVNSILRVIRYTYDFEDVAKLNQNTSNYFNHKFNIKLLTGSVFIVGGVACIWQGALVHPIYRHKYNYESDVKFRVPDSELTPQELSYYDDINKKADKEVKQRRNWYIAGGILSAVGAVFVWDAFEYRKLSLQVGSPEGIVGLKYTY